MLYHHFVREDTLGFLESWNLWKTWRIDYSTIDDGLKMMDDTGDTGTGVNDGFNGDTKPDPTKLAHSAIIKQVGIY